MRRVILHVDMDSFFSAIEMREHPELKGLPVVVGSADRARGVVSTCSYEARKYGIHSAMALSQAYRLCPGAKFLPVNMELYRRVSAAIMDILRGYADKMEQVSIDEAFLDITTKVRTWEEARMYAERIKKEIWDKQQLSCSIGIAPNKIVAKIASDFKKPNGLTVVEHAKEFLAQLPVVCIPGVGPKTEKVLKHMGITRIEQLANCDVQLLVSRLGKHGRRLHRIARGIDDSEVVPNRERKSLSRERTLAKDTDDIATLERQVEELAEEVHRALNGFVFKIVSIKVKYSNFRLITRSRTLKTFHSDLATLKCVAKELLRLVDVSKDDKIRLVGVRVAKLSLLDCRQQKLIC